MTITTHDKWKPRSLIELQGKVKCKFV